MRTTLTLDDDLADTLKEQAHHRGITFKEAVNSAIRRGIAAPLSSARRRKKFRVQTFRSAFRPGVDPLKLNQLADELEARRFGDGV
jgi:hypothetical protein